MTLKLSPSSMKLVEECPKCFWLQVVKKISRPSGAFPSLPSGVDKMLKEHFDRFRDNNKLPPEIKELKDVKLFDNNELLKKWRNNLKGIEYYDKENDVLLHGAVDNLLTKDNKLIVLDYKTRGFALKEDTAHYYQDQLDIYNFLLRKNGYETEDYSYLLFYLPEMVMESGEFKFKTELIKMKVNVEHAELLFKKAVEIVKGDCPDKGKDCVFCNWREK
ncbi:MAG: PD-(D/E)XK nuclease family protein [Nanoarchaeota archaeon]